MYYLNGKPQEVMRGSAAILQYKKEQLKKEAQFQRGLLTIVSERGLMYNTNYIMAFTRHCLQSFVSGSNSWSVVVNECKIEKDNKLQWVIGLNFYIGDLQTKNIDWKTDWRFCEVKDKRKQAKMLGLCKTTFPIKYPLWLTNWIIIEEEDYYR